jgi:hypothetical protein
MKHRTLISDLPDSEVKLARDPNITKYWENQTLKPNSKLNALQKCNRKKNHSII